MNLRQYTQADIEGKRVILRLDLDVGVNEAGEVDQYHDLRLERAIPTIKQLLDFGAKQIVMLGHRGRPKGERDEQLSLKPVRDRLQTLLDKQGVYSKIVFINDVLSEPVPEPLLMLENLRFWPGEKANDAVFAKSLAHWGDVYVNDAFGNSHRPHASMQAIVNQVKAAFAGLNVGREVEQLSEFAQSAARPFLAVMGGLKIETKLPLIKFLLGQADEVLLGGGLANTWLRAHGVEIGRSLVDEKFTEQAKTIGSDKIILPKDAVVASDDGSTRVVPVDAVVAGDFIGDIGPATVAAYREKLSAAKKILFNGPLGKFEDERFRSGTSAIVGVIAASRAETLSGGGDTIDILERLSATDKFGFVSVGGGAILAFLAGGAMPGLEALKISN